MNRTLASFVVLASALSLGAAAPIFIEAESFKEQGGWSLDTQFVVGMGSPYLLAHGVGKLVADAKTTFKLEQAGSYQLWARTKDWVGPWKAPGAPGRFQIVINGKPLANELGTQGADWNWQPAGSIDLSPGEITLALHDLTGFDGRCDAILLSADKNYLPPEGEPLAEARRAWLNLGGGRVRPGSGRRWLFWNGRCDFRRTPITEGGFHSGSIRSRRQWQQ